MSTRIAVVSLYAEDVPAATHFYRDVLGLRLAPHHGGHPHFDLDAAIQPPRLHQVELPWGVEQDAGSSWVMFHDPAGNLIELVQFGPSPMSNLSSPVTHP